MAKGKGPDPKLVEFGKKIIAYRGDAIKQEEFAKELGINRSTLSLIENGMQAPSFEVLTKIVQITNLNLNDLLDVKTQNYVVVDTNVILNRPEMIGVLLKDCEMVYIPQQVISELNYQKDHGKEKERRNASLCMNKLQEENCDNLDLKLTSDKGENNDDKIMNAAISLANDNSDAVVYLLTNDKDFRLKDTGDVPNLKIINSNQYNKIFAEEDGFNDALSQRFFMAVLKRDIDNARQLLKKNGNYINVNYIDTRSGLTPLIKAVLNKDYEMTEFLLGLDRIDVNAVDNSKHHLPPISHAIQMQDHKSSEKFVRLLIEKGANVNEPSQNSTNAFNMPLMIAAWHGHLNIVKILVENGAFINQQDKKNGFTALTKAVFNKEDVEIAKYLLENGADKNIMSYTDRKTPLDYAYDKGNKQLIELLKGNEVDD